MADTPEFHNYDPLRETQHQVDNPPKKPSLSDKDKTPEERLAELEAELAEKVRLGRISAGEMAYQLRRFDNAMVVEARLEGDNEPRHDASRTSEESAQRQERGDNGEGPQDNSANIEMTDKRAARLARLREITERMIDDREREPLDRDHGPGGRGR